MWMRRRRVLPLGRGQRFKEQTGRSWTVAVIANLLTRVLLLTLADIIGLSGSVGKRDYAAQYNS
jgi:hypothetical protein